MIEVLFLILPLVAATRRGSRRRRPRRRITTLNFSCILTLSSLAQETCIKVDCFPSDFAREFFAVSVDYTATRRDATAGEGPILFGFNHKGYTVAQVKEYLTAEAAVDPSNVVEGREYARRLVRTCGAFTGQNAYESVGEIGDMRRRKLKFAITDGSNLQFWGYNRDSAPLTAGSTIHVDGRLYGRWM